MRGPVSEPFARAGRVGTGMTDSVGDPRNPPLVLADGKAAGSPRQAQRRQADLGGTRADKGASGSGQRCTSSYRDATCATRSPGGTGAVRQGMRPAAERAGPEREENVMLGSPAGLERKL
jgi:hypothetical protein